MSWQWHRDGQPLPGENAPALYFTEVDSLQAGSYTVTATNLVGSTTSDPAVITVNPATEFAGPFATFGNSPRHAGYHPATLGDHAFSEQWRVEFDDDITFFRPTIADGMVSPIHDYAVVQAVGVVGAIIMPHNIYLHSALVQVFLIIDYRFSWFPLSL